MLIFFVHADICGVGSAYTFVGDGHTCFSLGWFS
jgi:hypothetical protein